MMLWRIKAVKAQTLLVGGSPTRLAALVIINWMVLWRQRLKVPWGSMACRGVLARDAYDYTIGCAQASFGTLFWCWGCRSDTEMVG